MSDSEAERGSEPPTAREDEAAQEPETVEEVDTPMPEASTNADEEASAPNASEGVEVAKLNALLTTGFEQEAGNQPTCDDDMSDSEAERGSEPPTALEDEAAQESETVEEVDTPMPEASTNADEEASAPNASEGVEVAKLNALLTTGFEQEAGNQPTCDDDMSDSEAERGSEPPTAREDEAAQESETVEEVDTPMPEASTNADEEASAPNASRPSTTPRRRSIAAQVADCKAKIAELQKLKVQRLEEEDYIGAHEAKQEILAHEQSLQALRLETMPTPTRGEDSKDEDDASRARSEDLEAAWRPHPDDTNLVTLEALDGQGLPFVLPADTFDRLYPYQQKGVAWMARLWQKGHGGVLADEMGLGKTIQVCALLNGARKAGATHALLLMPVTLLDQWSREARLWCPGWPVYTYYGTPSQRAKALRGLRRPMGGLLLTSYSLLSNCEDLLEVQVEDVPEPTHRRGRKPGGEKPSKRRKLDDDDGFDEGGDSEEELLEPELPGGELPALGSRRSWDLVVCDEAHRMKNMSSLLAKSLRKLKSSCRILLTGTPVQNALQDLWALMDFAQPGLLGNHATFVKTFSEPIDKGSVRGAKVWAVELKKHLAEQLRALIRPHLLRRTKVNAGLTGGASDVAEDVDMEGAENEDKDIEGVVTKLPSKRETIVWLVPSEEQKAAYKKVLEQSEVIKEACVKSKLGIEVFRAIGLLKRLCNHPLLLLPMPTMKDWANLLQEVQASAEDAGGSNEISDAEQQDDVTATETSPEAVPAADQQDDAQCGQDVESLLKSLSRSRQEVLLQSSKLRCLARLLPELASQGHRTLVFSQSVKMLDLVQICCLKPHGLRCLRIDGQTDTQARAEKVTKFNNQPERFQCMLLTTAVGGVGLNLTAADRVVIVDPAWNPATDAQAVDRAYRIGQTKEVRVYRLIMSGLIEDKMFRLQVFKMGLTRTALEADQQHRYFTAKEIRALFEWVDPSQGETRALLREKHGEGQEADVAAAAAEDGSDAWMQTPALDLSDFACLYGSSGEDDVQDEGFSAQVAEAKQKLEAADEKLRQKQQSRQEAEAEVARLAKEIEEVSACVEDAKEKRLRAEEAWKDRRSDLLQARKGETGAQQRLEKAGCNVITLQDRLLNHQHSLTTANEDVETAGLKAGEAAETSKENHQTFVQALSSAEGQLGLVDQRGAATGDCAADAAPDRLKKAQKALDKLKTSIENNSFRQAEYETLEEDVIKVEPGRERERHRLDQLITKALQRAETSRENVLREVQNFVEAGMWFAESLQKTQKRPVRMDQVKAVQSAVKAAFRQLPKAWQAVRSAWEAQTKAGAQRRKVALRRATAVQAKADAEAAVQSALNEQKEAEAEEAQLRGERGAKESDLAAAEAARQAAHQREADVKRRRDELKAQQPAARDAVKAARAEEREADAERKALHARAEKREKEQELLEEAKSTAVRQLKNEEYDANQVVLAYEEKRGSKKAQE
ncbi:CHR24 [Symbiodinium natans]|uniref:CHR24 protein n=1 Tax=Symbiodinium natans TaxID=878477 RepID=A0A812P1E9_9DINO|nr:CHR24 [Symbiodinium natans]